MSDTDSTFNFVIYRRAHDSSSPFIITIHFAYTRCTVIKENVISMGIEEIIVAMPSVKGEALKQILEICKRTKCQLKILPGVYAVSYTHLWRLRPEAGLKLSLRPRTSSKERTSLPGKK